MANQFLEPVKPVAKLDSTGSSFLDLLQGGPVTGLSDRQALAAIQSDLSDLLRKQIKGYTGGDTSSIREETATRLLLSICFAIDCASRAQSSPADKIRLVQEDGLNALYDRGIGLIRSCLAETALLHRELKDRRLAVPLLCYQETLDLALPAFLEQYDVLYDAHDATCSMDYPLLFNDLDGYGVFAIKDYLERLKLETSFCACFADDKTTRLLQDYAEQYQIDILDIPFNLMGCLYDQLIISVIAGNDPPDLFLSRRQFDALAGSLPELGPDSLHGLLENAAAKIAAFLPVRDPKMLAYLQRYQPVYEARFLQACRHRQLANLAVVDDRRINPDKLLFHDHAPMADLAFDNLVEQIQACEDLGGKISLITGQAGSIRDYLDLLEADCLYGDEYLALFAGLADLELAVLGRVVFSDALYGGPLALSAVVPDLAKADMPHEWRSFYLDFVMDLSAARQKDLENRINNLSSPDLDL